MLSSLKIIFFLFFIIHTISIKAQKPETMASGTITGRIVDSTTRQPIEYASISLVTQADDKVVNGATTDDKGKFALTAIPDGTYKMQVYFIGFKTGIKTNIVINKNNSIIALGDFKLISTTAKLKEVEVTAEKGLIENKIDKMVYNAEKDVTSQGGVASDMLKKIPQISVDIDGNVELQGNSNIRFLINGKPSTLFGNNIADVLQAIPASQIQSIEVITSPGAKYDAEGTGGIINIILKKVTTQGINGNISVTGSTRNQTGSFNINGRKGKIGVNAFVSGNTLIPAHSITDMNRVTQDPALNQSTSFLQNGYSDFSRKSLQGGLGFDWDISAKDNFNVSASCNYFGYDGVGSSTRQTIVSDASGNEVSNFSDVINPSNHFHNLNYDWNATYKRKFKKEGQELEFSYNSSYGLNRNYYWQRENYINVDTSYSGNYGNNPTINQETNFELNYTHPLPKDVIFETGGKLVIDNVNSNSQQYLLNTSDNTFYEDVPLSTNINYNRYIYAAYVSATFKLFKWLDVKAGCRDEYTESNGFFSNSGVITFNPYNTVVPSAIISHTFAKNQTFKIGYSHRIQRPDYHDLNPFVNTVDPYNVQTGNPNLRPEIGDKIELTYSKSFNKGSSINVVLFYRGNKDDIQSYVTYYPNYIIGDSTYHNVAVTTRENVGREDNFGVNIYGSVPITSKINVRTNISLFQRYITNGNLAGNNTQGFNYRINMNATYEVISTLIIEAFGNFNSPRTNVQGKVPSFTTYSFAVRKQFFNKKFSVAITTANPFNKYINQKTELDGNNFTLYTDRQIPLRSIGINLTYKFGKMEFKREKRDEEDNMTPMGN